MLVQGVISEDDIAIEHPVESIDEALQYMPASHTALRAENED
jgi:hypothetical protein